jgi:hypothetical protein
VVVAVVVGCGGKSHLALKQMEALLQAQDAQSAKQPHKLDARVGP